MDRLYTPWRWEYVVNPKSQGCPFCHYLQQPPLQDAENLLLMRSQRSFVVLNRYPYTNGHLMVLPNHHAGQLHEIDDAAQAEMMHLTSYCTTLLDAAYHPQGYNIGINVGKAAGAGLEAHLHVHVVPRWQGDTNFMPVVGQTRVLPETLEDTYARLRALAVARPFRA